METELIAKCRGYAQGVLTNLPEFFTYHNLEHTTTVVSAAEEIGRQTGLPGGDLESVIIAAWLHDTGYEKGATNHEHRAAETAARLLRDWGAPQQQIDVITKAIEATRMPQQPETILEQVLCDADLYHLTSPDLLRRSDGLRQELEQLKKIKFDSDEEWRRFNLKFLKSHSYFTPYGRQVLEDRKKKNVKKLKQMLKPEVDKDYVKDLEKELSKLKSKLDKKGTPDRGIETMFKIASQNHTTLSGMADTKANIMISVNSIILSVVITVLFRKLEEFPNLLIPTLMLVVACLLTIVYAILATRPNISSGKFTKEDIKEKKTNLLFFGNFYRMELGHYESGVKEMMKDADYLYSSLIKDIYFNGVVLARKYKLLRISYSIFMFGFVGAIVGFTIALLLYYYPADRL